MSDTIFEHIHSAATNMTLRSNYPLIFPLLIVIIVSAWCRDGLSAPATASVSLSEWLSANYGVDPAQSVQLNDLTGIQLHSDIQVSTELFPCRFG